MSTKQVLTLPGKLTKKFTSWEVTSCVNQTTPNSLNVFIVELFFKNFKIDDLNKKYKVQYENINLPLKALNFLKG